MGSCKRASATKAYRLNLHVTDWIKTDVVKENRITYLREKKSFNEVCIFEDYLSLCFCPYAATIHKRSVHMGRRQQATRQQFLRGYKPCIWAGSVHGVFLWRARGLYLQYWWKTGYDKDHQLQQCWNGAHFVSCSIDRLLIAPLFRAVFLKEPRVAFTVNAKIQRELEILRYLILFSSNQAVNCTIRQ